MFVSNCVRVMSELSILQDNYRHTCTNTTFPQSAKLSFIALKKRDTARFYDNFTTVKMLLIAQEIVDRPREWIVRFEESGFASGYFGASKQERYIKRTGIWETRCAGRAVRRPGGLASQSGEPFMVFSVSRGCLYKWCGGHMELGLFAARVDWDAEHVHGVLC